MDKIVVKKEWTVFIPQIDLQNIRICKRKYIVTY